ncbi:MAG TPA: LPS assembly lipoprotein LptE [Syntrophales bacterium]|nr:LPS assembly lipoprotein LptE [Syntrophales bacterium]
MNRDGRKAGKAIFGGAVLALLCCILSMTAGCGYRFSPGGEWLDSGIRTVFVDNIVNSTSEPFVEIYVRGGFEDQFRKSPRFRLAAGREEADAVLRGAIASLSTSYVAYDRYDKASESRAVMVLNLSFEERRTGKKLWSVENFSGSESFRIDQANPNTTSTNKQAALQKLSADMAEKAYRNLMSGF